MLMIINFDTYPASLHFFKAKTENNLQNTLRNRAKNIVSFYLLWLLILEK
jgi:hypothetical protein